MNNFSEGMKTQTRLIYRDVYRGIGIKANEYEIIKKVSSEVYQSNVNYMSKYFSE